MPRPITMKVEEVPVTSIEPHPDNPRLGNVEAIAMSLLAHGQFRPLVVQKSTGYVLAGNHTLLAANHLGWTKVQVVRLDVDDAEARRILLADNRTSDLGHYNDPGLAALLSDLAHEPDGLTGTGYEQHDLDVLLAQLKRSGHATDFLDKFLETAPPAREEHEPVGGGGDGATPFRMTFPVDDDQRATIATALNRIKEANGFPTSVEALVWLCGHYLEGGAE